MQDLEKKVETNIVFCVNNITTSSVGRVEHPNNDFQFLIGISQ